MKIILVILSVTVLIGCKNAQQSAMNDSSEASQSTQGWESVKSQSGKYILFYEEKEDVQNPKLKKMFYVTNASGDRIYENAIYGGYVKWYDDSKVEFFSPPGVMPPDKDKDDFVMIYDLETQETFPKSRLKK